MSASNFSPKMIAASLSGRLADAVAAIGRGEPVILIDSEDRENEGDLVLAAEFATPERVNFFIRQACGLVCLSLEGEQVDRLGIPPMVSENQSPRKTAFTVSIEAATGVSTGISAQDRSRTIQVAANPKSGPQDLVMPGHIFPLRAAPGGVLQRAGHTEGSIELCKLAGLNPAAVICEIINEDGTMARRDDLEKFAKKFGIQIVTIEEIIRYRTQTTAWLAASRTANFPHRFNATPMTIQSFRNPFSRAEHAVVRMNSNPDAIPLVRIHSECLTGDALGSHRCDCGLQLEMATKAIAESGNGVLIYLKNQEGRGIGLWNKIESYALQDQGLDTVDANIQLGFHADERHYAEAAAILNQLGISEINLMTNSPHKQRELEQLGIRVNSTIPLLPKSPAASDAYLKTKRERFFHLIPEKGSAP